MDLSIVYRYLISPFQTLDTYYRFSPRRLAYAALVLVSIAEWVLMASHTGPSRLGVVMILVIAFAIVIALEAMLIDFTAQLFGYSAKSVTLYYWLCLSMLPTLLDVPIRILTVSIPSLAFLFQLASFSVMIWILVLQVQTVKRLYGTSLAKAILLYCFPCVVFLGALMMVGSLLLKAFG